MEGALSAPTAAPSLMTTSSLPSSPAVTPSSSSRCSGGGRPGGGRHFRCRCLWVNSFQIVLYLQLGCLVWILALPAPVRICNSLGWIELLLRLRCAYGSALCGSCGCGGLCGDRDLCVQSWNGGSNLAISEESRFWTQTNRC